MKVAIFSEFTTDEAVLKILVEGIIGEEIDHVPNRPRLQSRGSSSVLRDAPIIIRSLYFDPQIEFLIVVCDSDNTPIHKKEHNQRNNKEANDCRLCKLRKIVNFELANLNSAKGNLKVAIGVAVPAIEAWLLCGVDPHSNEATWIYKQSEKGLSTDSDRVALKNKLHGSKTVSKMEHQIQAAKRLAEDIEQLEKSFPEGFGSLAAEVRSWKK